MIGKAFVVLGLLSSSAAFADTTFNGVYANKFEQKQIVTQSVTVKSPATMRVLSFTVKPGGLLSAHRHTGQGFMCVTQGDLSGYVSSKPYQIPVGGCVYDSGNAIHDVKNNGTVDVVGYTFEVIPTAVINKTARGVPGGMDSILPPK